MPPDASIGGHPRDRVVDHGTELRRLRARVRHLEREKAAAEGFAAMAAHELVVPLVLAETSAAMLAERLDDIGEEDAAEELAQLARVSARSRVLVETLLHDARAHERPLQTEPVDLEALTHECVGSLALEVCAREVEIDIGPLPWVSGEEPLLASVMTNLIVNALKYGPRTGGTIRVLSRGQDEGWCDLAVESDGPPIPEEDRERIFAPFRRGVGERRAPGLGLGLAICRRIVERHGGRLDAVSGPARPNAFVFSLPVA